MFAIEFFLYLALLLLFYYFSGLHFQFGSIPLFYKLSTVFIIYLLAIGQVNKSSHQTYPFTYWGMYSQSMPSQDYYEYLVQLDDEHSIHYPFELVTFTSPRAFMRKLRNLQRSADENEQDEERLHQTADALIAIYERANPGKTVRSFSINRVHVSLTDNERGYTTSTYPEFKKTVE